jgi:putative ABC transport system substrate-binding protein
MKRRDVIAGIGSATAAFLPLAARAQQKPLPVLGFLASTALAQIGDHIAGMRQGLGEAGFVERQTIAIEYRSADDAYDRLPALAADLIARKVDVIVAQALPAARAAKAASATLPIVFGVGIDPVAEGLVASLARPGGNLTGVTLQNIDLVAKRFGLMTELAPKARLIALLVNPNVPTTWTGSVEDAARAKGIRLLIVKAATPGEIDAAFATMAQQRADALLIGGDAFLARRPQIAELALRHSIPTLSTLRECAVVGGLASYGSSIKDAYRVIGTMAGRILKGAKPAEIAVQQAVRFEMVLNMRTARALGLDIAPLLLAQADEVIE